MFHRSRFLPLICDIYILIWAVYCIHWYAIMPGSVVDSLSSILLAVNLAISFICLVLCQRTKLPILFKGINILIIFFFIYGIIPIIYGGEIYNKVEISPGAFLIGPLRSLLPIYAFYYFATKDILTEKRIKIYFFCFLLLYLFFFVSFNNLRMAESSRDAFTNNLGYIFVSLLPFVLFFDKNLIIKYFLLFFILLVVVFSMKRGAILIGMISLLYIIKKQWGQSSSKQKIWISIVILAICYLIYHYTYSFFSQNEYFIMRIEDTLSGDSSGRDGITKDIFNYFYNEANFTQMLFGGGADNSMYICDGYQAHNDWLEILANQGIFGIIIYLSFWIISFKQVKRMRPGSIYRQVLTLTLLGIFIKTFFSMSYAAFPTTYCFLIGYCLSRQYDV